MENTIAIITAVLAFITSLASIIITILNEKTRVKTETITCNRVEWIKDVRELLMDFLEVYADISLVDNDRQQKLVIIKGKITLYFREGIKSYSDLTQVMDECISEGYSPSQCDKLIKKSQRVLSGAWIRAKREAGIREKEDKEYERQLGN